MQEQSKLQEHDTIDNNNSSTLMMPINVLHTKCSCYIACAWTELMKMSR